MLLLSCGVSTIRFMPPLMITNERRGRSDDDSRRQPRRSAERMSLRHRAAALSLASSGWLLPRCRSPQREPVLKQIDLPHNYYYREMYLPQLTSGPSSVALSPDGQALVYSMAGSLWRQEIGSESRDRAHARPGLRLSA